MIQINRTMRPDALQHIEELSAILFEGEQNAHQFIIAPAEGVSFSGYSVTARFVRADGQNVAPGGELVSGSASVVLTPSCYAVAGRFKLFIYVVSASETVCVYACAGTVVQTVGANGTAGSVTPIIEAYDSRYQFSGGPNGEYTQSGITITNDGRLYTLSGTGQNTGIVSVAALDGSVAYANRVAKVSLKKGRSYAFSLQASAYPTYTSGGETIPFFGAFTLGAFKGTGSGTQFVMCSRSNVNWDTPGNRWVYYCEQDEDIWLNLGIYGGYSVGGEDQFFDLTGIKLLVGFGETDGTEVGHVNRYWTAYGDTKLKVAKGKTLKIGDTTLSEAQLQALLALLN